MRQSHGEKMTVQGTDEKAGERADAQPLPAGLYVVATPIGNLGDITLRALDTLRGADLIACEDTRVTAKLLARYGIQVPTTAYHDHNAGRVRPRLLARIADGGVVALVSDAGTPLVSDPGYRLVAEARQRGLAVTALPGASALLAALAVAGLPTDRFVFLGFLPSKTAARRTMIERYAAVPASLVIYESAGRLPAMLADLADVLGDRPAAVCRELTKRFEEVASDPLPALADRYAAAGAPKGEIVVVVGPPAERAADADEVDRALTAALRTLSVREAAAAVAYATGARRRDVYQRALALTKAGPEAREDG